VVGLVKRNTFRRKIRNKQQKTTKNNMLAIERHRRIMDLAKRDGTVRTQDLASHLEVTEETVRRDLDSLTRQGLLRRTHGGAADISLMIDEIPQSEREARQSQEKIIIAKLAIPFVGENETIMLDASSTVLEFARHLPGGRNLRVVTYAHSILEKLAMRNDIEVILLGGIYEAKGRRYRGMLTEMGMRALRIDRFFFSGGGFHPRHGIGEPNPEEARFKASVIAHAEWNCAMLDHSKLGAITDHYFVKPNEIDVFITDQGKNANLKDLKKVVSG